MEQANRPSRLRFGAFEIQPGERRLLVDGRPAVVAPRAFDLLVLLAERAGRLVSKHEILDRVWPNLVVEENNLQVQVSALRKVLGADAIATVPGFGYRLTLQPARNAAAPALPAPEQLHNLPHPLTSFVGRERELSEVTSLVAKSRLLTLTGFGGIGKTRLALQAVGPLAAGYAAGAWFVELAALTDPGLVPQAVASALKVKEAAGRPVLEALLAYVRDRRLILVLDSCEHLVQACADLAKRLLQAGGELTILATSRERLNVAGETSYAVQPLSLPEASAALSIAALSRYEAVRLFVDRAAAVQPGFELHDRNALAVTEICRRVDGIPLAIELAAARARAMSVEKIAERLSDRFHLLTRGDRTALPHRQTLRALVDWSHELLSLPERSLFRRLAVFPGSFTLEAAEAVGTGDDIAARDVVDLLTELVDKSLVVVEAMGERYRLLDTVREYAQERLGEAKDEDAARSRHLAFYLALAEHARPRLFTADQAAWVARLDLERQNLLSAHAWCDHAPEHVTSGLRLAHALRPYWFWCGLLTLGHRIALEALSRPGAEARDLARCHVALDVGSLCNFLGRKDDAQPFLEEGLAIAREIGNRDRTAEALRVLGIVCLDTGRHEAARRHFEEGLHIAREVGDPFRLLEALNAMANLHRAHGNWSAARPLYEESLAIARQRGNLEAAAIQLACLAMVAVGVGAGDLACRHLLEALAITRQGGSRWVGQLVMAVGAGLAANAAEWRRSAQLYGAAIAQNERMGVREDPADDSWMAPLIARTRATLGPTVFAAAEAAGRALSYEAALAEIEGWLADRGAAGRRMSRPADSGAERESGESEPSPRRPVSP